MRQPLILTSALLSFLFFTAESADAQATVPYEINFKQTCEGWNAADNNDDGYTWKTDFLDFSGVYMEGMYAPHNDDFISPGFQLAKGHTYNISTVIEQMMLFTSDAVTLVAGTDKAAMTEITKLSVANFGPNEGSVEFTPEADGEYYFAFRFTLPEASYGATLSLCNFTVTDITKEDAVKLPYAINFKQTCEGWNATDNNGDSYTWNTDFLDFSGVYMEGMYAPHNDDFISPKFPLSKGHTYNISTVIEQMMLLSADAVTLVGGTDKAAMTEIAKLSVANFGPNENSTEFTPETDGDYYFAFRFILPEASYGATLSLCNFAISELMKEEAAEIPYDINFKERTEGWTITDNNGDGYTWKTDFPDYGIYMEGNYAPHNDDLISPKFILSAEKNYKIATLLEIALPSGRDVVSLMAGTDKAAMSEIGKLSVDNQGPNADELIFTPENDGEYYFAFRNTSPTAPYLPTQYLSACNFSISEHEASQDGELISTDFSGTDPLKGWTIIDANSDNNTWGMEDGLPGVVYNGEAASNAEDWLITPMMQLLEGQDYIVKYTLKQAGAFGEDIVEVRFGNEASVNGMSTVLSTEKLEFDNGNGSITGATRISCMESGMYHVGLRIITNEPNGIISVTFIEILAADKAIPMPVSKLSAESDEETKNVTLSWMNPVQDTMEADITSVDILIYENDNLIETLNDREAGATESYTYSPAVFSGDVTYTVKAAINGIESEGASTTICLDDIKGNLVLVKEMPINYDSSQEWVLIDNGGNGKWVYESFQWFYFKHPNGKPTAEDDWAISPATELQSGVRYIVKYQLATNMESGATFDVTLGNAQTHEEQTRILDSRKDLKQNGIGEFETKQFAVNPGGTYHIGFHATDVSHSMTLSKVSLYYIEQVQTGIENINSKTDIRYDKESSQLIVSGTFAKLSVYDMQGRIVKTLVPEDNAFIDIAGLAKGMYMVQAADAKGNVSTIKILK